MFTITYTCWSYLEITVELVHLDHDVPLATVPRPLLKTKYKDRCH